mmetsp:Transcript_19680/g.39148  ORF Transcript_19680/g.39148 Transcript_19680/m.39148 type:complete len:223 (-) Transcript_19680:99-767(-)
MAEYTHGTSARSQASDSRYLVGKLSEPSRTTSHPPPEGPARMRSAVSAVNSSSYVNTSTLGFTSPILAAADAHLLAPIEPVPWMIWRCRFDSSTVSASTMPTVPTPAAARYSSAGDPSPPAPTHSTEEPFRRRCPRTPTVERTKWREYRATSSLVSSGRRSGASGASDGGGGRDGNGGEKAQRRPNPRHWNGPGSDRTQRQRELARITFILFFFFGADRDSF